jgi:tetrathionate reductase subunit B
MTQSRRSFLKSIGVLTAGLATYAKVEAAVAATDAPAKHRWAMVVDVRKCIGCQACTVACALENQVPENHFRTMASTYEVHDGKKTGTYMLPRLCNHCDDPPCIPVCPVKATYQRPDGIVVVDNTRCVGCGYCVQACPYDARFINPVTQTADKCTFCAHRLAAGLLPACVETCVGGARVFGDLADPNSTVSRLLKEQPVKVLRPEMKTKPHVFYIGLDGRFQGKVKGQQALWRPAAHDKHGEGV